VNLVGIVAFIAERIEEAQDEISAALLAEDPVTAREKLTAAHLTLQNVLYEIDFKRANARLRKTLEASVELYERDLTGGDAGGVG
jgi:hypothetical protein